MKPPRIERRRTPRVQLLDGHTLSLNASVPVRVLDISRSGVSIGSKTVIGAGSVVTRDIPAGVFAAGNPCRVIKDIKE